MMPTRSPSSPGSSQQVACAPSTPVPCGGPGSWRRRASWRSLWRLRRRSPGPAGSPSSLDVPVASSHANSWSSAADGHEFVGLGGISSVGHMSYDVAAVRAQFPALRTGTAHFDGPGGTQVPAAVAQAVARTLTSPIANRGRITAAERLADDVVRDARQALADLLGADPRGVGFGRSATQPPFDVPRARAAGWGPGDEVVVSRLDHDANIRPWVIAAGAAGATVRWAAFDPAT